MVYCRVFMIGSIGAAFIGGVAFLYCVKKCAKKTFLRNLKIVLISALLLICPFAAQLPAVTADASPQRISVVLSPEEIQVLPKMSVPSVSAHSAIMVESSGGGSVYERNADEQMKIASTTKIMTAVVALEHGKLHDIVTVGAQAANTEGSSMGLTEGEQIRLIDLLYGLMLSSGNDAAVAVAEHIAGSSGSFAVMMNEKAAELGMTSTNFENPSGLDGAKHYSTARDMARLAVYAMKNSVFRKLVSKQDIAVKSTDGSVTHFLSNHNRLINFDKGFTGVKTGYTKAAGRCLVSSVTRSGVEFVCVSLNASDDWNDHMALADYGYSLYSSVDLAKIFGFEPFVNISGGSSDFVRCIAKNETIITIANAKLPSLSAKVSLVPELEAPVTAGTVVGSFSVFSDGTDGETIFETDIICAYSVPSEAKASVDKNSGK